MHTVLRRDPADTTITVDGETLTHADLYERAATLADRLTGAGPVAVIAHPTLQTVIAIVAGLHAGVPVVPVPPDSGPTELHHILTDSRATVLLDGVSITSLPAPPAPATAGETALILYTSGTTGTPACRPATIAITVCRVGCATTATGPAPASRPARVVAFS